MDERVLQFRVGVVMIVALILTVVLMVVLTNGLSLPGFFTRDYTLYITFPEAPGVKVDSPIQRDGVLVGRVTDVELLPERGVRVTARIDGDRVLRQDQVPRITSKFPLGNAIVEFVPSSDPSAPETPLADGDHLQGTVSGDPLDAVQRFAELDADLKIAIQSITRAGNEATVLASNVNTLVDNNATQMSRLVQKSEVALDGLRTTINSANTTFQNVNELLDDEEFSGDMQRAFREMPQLVSEARVAVNEARIAFNRFGEASETFRRNMNNLEGITQPLGERGEAIVTNIERSVSTVDELLTNANSFASGLEDGDGTLGMLMNDPDLYLRLERAAANVEEITRRVMPIVDDARIAVDKVARDPGGSIGVRGILDRSNPGLKHFPQNK
jgi:phospholipid/cholesterol/gamma-HCH transport system substrate-binding protein